MKKNVFRAILALAIIFGVGYLAVSQSFRKKEIISVRGQKFQIERAQTPQARELGLGERDALCQECGMVFFFPEKDQHSFWMRGMRFPLDIIWFNSGDGKIVQVEKNIPADSQKIYTPAEKADRVLEINAGLAEKHQIQVGDRIIFGK